MTDIQAYSTTSGWPMACVNIDDLLKNVNAEITAYEAKQLAKFKSELEAFHKKKDGVVKSYKEKYQTLRDRWCRQNGDIECLWRHLTCIFKDKWQQYIDKCVCPPRADIAARQAEIAERQKCCKGELEAKRDAAKAEADAAKLYLDIITANQAKLEAALSENDKWIKQINQLLLGKDAAVSIYIFWFKLLPAHIALAPSDLLHCLDFLPKGQTPDELCPPKGTADPSRDSELQGKPQPVPHPVPWLVDPDTYAGEIDCAWTLYRDAKKAHGDADAAFVKAPDDLASLQKSLDLRLKNLDAKVQDCLKDIHVKNHCGCGEVTGERETQISRQPEADPQAAANPN